MSSVGYEREISIPPEQPLPPVAEPALHEKGTYGQILKSSVLVGGSSLLNIAIGIVRTKVMAVLLGPAGFGLFGLYGSITTLTQTVAGMGINSSGVRQIAESAGSDDADGIAQTAVVLRRISILLGLLGATLLIVFSKEISKITFGSTQHAAAVGLLSLAVLFQLVSAGQGALIQGMRRIADLAKMNVISALWGLTISIPVVYFFREKGIVPSLVCVAATTILTSWCYSRKIRIKSPSLSVLQVGQEAAALLKLGVAFMASGLMVTGVAYMVRVILLQKVGFAATGIYQSAWALGGLYVGVILQAMGADFYPRLSAAAKNNEKCNRLVNEQALVGLLLAGPGVIATLTFAPLVIALFYSAKFGLAVGVLRWVCLGATLQVVTWPMGFIILAKARQDFFLLSEFVWAIIAAGLAWSCITTYGINGAGIAFFLSYIVHAALVYPIVRHLSGFQWSTTNKRVGAFFFFLITAVFGSFYLLPLSTAVWIGGGATIGGTAFSVRCLAKLVLLEDLPRPIQRMLARLYLIPSF
jgi:enterobacterial common antigen flippase